MPDATRDYLDYYYRSADDLTLYARDYPGPEDSQRLPVLCMHGLTRNSADFAWIASRLAKTRRVISVDQRGRGLSDYDPVAANYTPATYVGDMFKLLDELGIQRLLVIGTSMGGLMAMIMANRQARRFAGIVLNDIGPELDRAGLDRIKNYVGKRGEISNWDDAVARTREINAVAFPRYTDEEWLRLAQGLYFEANGVPVIAHDAAIAEALQDVESNAVPADLWSLFHGMSAMPMLVVRGELSDLLAMDCIEKMQAISPTLRVAQIPDRGHAPMLDEPAAVKAVEAFIAEIEAA